MRKTSLAVPVVAILGCVLPAWAQQPCPSMVVIANSPEDGLVTAVATAEKPEDQVAALDKYAQDHAESKFMPCVNEYYTAAYVRLNNFDKAIEYGEKDLAASYQDLNLFVNLMKAYVGAGKANDAAFSVFAKAPDQIKAESNPAKPAGISDADWEKSQQELAATMKDIRAYMEYAFFQLVARVPDPQKRIGYLDAFMKSYSDTANAGQVNVQYFVAYKMVNNAAKADEYGEKAIAADPNDVAALNLVADDYASRRSNLDKAAQYAHKVLTLAPAMKKPEGLSDEQFKANQNAQLGMAHTTLGYIAFQRAASTHKVAGAVQEFNAAAGLLNGNPELQAKALYFLGNAYEFQMPPNHRAAREALSRAANLPTPWQGQARDLLAKIPQ